MSVLQISLWWPNLIVYQPSLLKPNFFIWALVYDSFSESRKTLEHKFIFQIGTLNPHGINERFSFN